MARKIGAQLWCQWRQKSSYQEPHAIDKAKGQFYFLKE